VCSSDLDGVRIERADGNDLLDLVVGNEGQANRLYLNDGQGHFAAGVNITADTDATTEIYTLSLHDALPISMATAPAGTRTRASSRRGTRSRGSPPTR